jgi:hypothetical protein
LFLSICLLIACGDCNQNVSGTVLDKETKEPIDGAYVQNTLKNYVNSYTDKKGYFELRSISGGIRKCPPMQVAVTAKTYEIKIAEIENGAHDTIYLERIK